MSTLTRLAFVLALLAPAGAAGQADGPANYAVTVAGDTLRTEVEFEDPLIGTSYVSVAGERREIEEFAMLHLDGRTHAVVDGRRLAQLTVDGRLRLYSHAVTVAVGPAMAVGPNGALAPMMAVPYGQFVAKETGYLQVEGGPVVLFSEAALRDAMRGNPASLQHLDRARKLGSAGRITTSVGLVALFVGSALSYMHNGFEGVPRYWPVMLGGAAATFVGTQALTAEAHVARQEAIDVYNAE